MIRAMADAMQQLMDAAARSGIGLVILAQIHPESDELEQSAPISQDPTLTAAMVRAAHHTEICPGTCEACRQVAS